MSDGGCIDEETALALAEGSVSPERRRELSAHVDRCAACFEIVVDAARALGDDGAPDGPASRAASPEEPAADGEPGEQRSLAPGDTVGHFQVERLLGRGGMGEVYLAHDTELGRHVALKMISPALIGAPEASERFRVEARATARLSHPNIVTIHAIGQHRGAPYVALEYVEGTTLRERLSRGKLELREALRVGLDIAEAVSAAHERGVWHRDLKPANVALGDDGRVRVLDFGLAKITDQEPLSGARSVRGGDTTVAGGTPLYMAPEQWRGERSTAASDVWALGLLLFELVTGEHPFLARDERRDTAEAARLVRERALAGRPLLVRAALPAGLADLVARCLRVDPGARPSAGDVATALRAESVTMGPRTAPNPGAQRAPSGATPSIRQARGTSRRWALLPAGAALIGVLLLFGKGFVPGAATPPSSPASTDVPGDSPSAVFSTSPTPEGPSSGSIPAEPPAPASVDPAPSAQPSAGGAPRASASRLYGDPRCFSQCQRWAWCTWTDQGCAVGSDADCHQWESCRTAGRCTRQDKTCVVGSDADCKGSAACRQLGLCVKQGSECVAGTDADCRASERCLSEGLCTKEGTTCVARADADCRASRRCRESGLCTRRGDECGVGSDADCRASERCKSHGQCTKAAARCRPGGDEDCQSSALCKSDGLCIRRGLACGASEAGCRASRACAARGLCSAGPEGACVK